MQTHQNNFHKQVILDFHAKLQGVEIEKISKEDVEMLSYLEDIHKNSNKGIKGRGRDSKVLPVEESQVPNSTGPPCHNHPHVIPPTSQPHHVMPHSMAHQTTYMGHGSMMVTAGPRTHNPYEVYEIKPENMTSAPPMPSPAAIYDEQPRPLAFADRMF